MCRRRTNQTGCLSGMQEKIMKKYSVNVHYSSICQYANEGLVGALPKKMGPPGHISKATYKLHCATLSSFIPMNLMNARAGNNKRHSPTSLTWHTQLWGTWRHSRRRSWCWLFVRCHRWSSINWWRREMRQQWWQWSGGILELLEDMTAEQIFKGESSATNVSIETMSEGDAEAV